MAFAAASPCARRRPARPQRDSRLVGTHLGARSRHLCAALSGLGLCQLPDFYVEDHLRSGALVELLAEHRPASEDVRAVYPHRRHLPSKVRLAVEHLQQEFRSRSSVG